MTYEDDKKSKNQFSEHHKNLRVKTTNDRSKIKTPYNCMFAFLESFALTNSFDVNMTHFFV